MSLVLAYEDAKVTQRKKPGTVVRSGKIEDATNTLFFGSPNTPEGPHAMLTQHRCGNVSKSHFHIVDQFQVILDGKGALGRNDYSPYCIHFSRAYTPYGPLIADSATGFTHFALRPHYDPGAQRPVDKLKDVVDRDPWQITRPATFPTLESGSADVMLRPIPDIEDKRGLAAYTLSMKPDTKTCAPDPSHGDGQYVLVVKGSLLHDQKEYQAYALVFVYPKEAPFQICAGPQGLEAFVLNFPSPRAQAKNAG